MQLFSFQYRVIAITCLFYTLAFNYPFFNRFNDVFPISDGNWLLFLSAFVLLWSIHFLFFSLLASRWTTKWLLLLGLFIGAITSYFSQSYGIVIDLGMIQNSIETDKNEILGLISPLLFLYLILGALLPSILLIRSKITHKSYKIESISKISSIFLAGLTMLISILPFTAEYSSFFREYKPIRYLATPITPLYSLIQFSKNALFPKGSENTELKRMVIDDHIEHEAYHPAEDFDLIIMVVGETARADHFSLNGYNRKTNPLLEQEPFVVSFNNFWSCGTSTSVSVPCMFAIDERENFKHSEASAKYNVLDVLSRNNVAVLWRDNNSSSKGVADRVKYESFREPEINPICDVECRDEGMLFGLEDFINEHPNQDIFIALHTMGSHGPEYYKRYPKQFEHFTPTCESNQLATCTHEELINTYDNTIVYTDYVIAKTIAFLKKHPNYETTLLYVSDHGESLGENNLYLHGMPYFLAPKVQTHVPVIAWLPPNSDFNFQQTNQERAEKYSHDDIYCSILAGMEVATSACKDKKLILKFNP